LMADDQSSAAQDADVARFTRHADGVLEDG
jgi:hypothetical protein